MSSVLYLFLVVFVVLLTCVVCPAAIAVKAGLASPGDGPWLSIYFVAVDSMMLTTRWRVGRSSWFRGTG